MISATLNAQQKSDQLEGDNITVAKNIRTPKTKSESLPIPLISSKKEVIKQLIT